MQKSNTRPSFAPWLIVGGVVLCMALVMVYRHQSKPSRADADMSQPATSEPRIPAVSAGASRAPRTSPDLTAAAVRAMAGQREALVEKRKQVQAKVDRTQATFANRYQNESVDAGWAGPKEAQLTRLATSPEIQQNRIEARNLNVDCKRSMCRITGEFDSMGAGDDWFALYMNNVAAEVPVASYKYIRNPDGTVTINVYAVGRK